MDSPDLTELLRQMQRGDAGAQDAVFSAMHGELRRIGAALMAHERPNHTLQPTALISQAFVEHLRSISCEIRDRRHFLAIAAGAMRRVLIDHARKHKTAKRTPPVPAREFLEGRAEASANFLIDFDRAVSELETLHPKSFEVFQYRYYLQCTLAEVASICGTNITQVRQEYQFALAFLAHRLE